MSCPVCRDIAAALAPRGAWPDGSPQAALAVVRAVLDRPDRGGAGWSAAAVHRAMLADAARTDAFRRALEAVVRPGDVVVDVGAGTGVLSAFAARAGAAEVVAVERSDLAATLGEVVRDNGLDDVVRVLKADARTATLPQARVLVSEWLGHLVFGDGMWPAVAAARDACLAPGGVVVPARVDLRVAPLEDARLRAEGPGWWDGGRWGLDLRALAALEAERPEARPWSVDPDGLLAPSASARTISCATASADAGTFERDVSFEVAHDGTLDAIAGWFTAELAPGVDLDTGPWAPATHWRQYVLPVRPCAVKRGQRLALRLAMDEGRKLEARLALDGRVVADARYW